MYVMFAEGAPFGCYHLMGLALQYRGEYGIPTWYCTCTYGVRCTVRKEGSKFGSGPAILSWHRIPSPTKQESFQKKINPKAIRGGSCYVRYEYVL